MQCFLIPQAFRLLPHLLVCVVCLMLLPACKTFQTSKKPAFLVQYVKKGVLDKTVKTLFGDSAKFDKDHVEFSKDFDIEFIKSKVITNEEIRDFLSPKGGLIAYTENFESWVKWERTPDNKVRVSVFYKETPQTNKQGYLPTPHQPNNCMTTTAPLLLPKS